MKRSDLEHLIRAAGKIGQDSEIVVIGSQAILGQFPEGYRHLAYLQSSLGFKVKRDMPGLRGPESDALYALGKKWLAGGAV